MIKDPWIDVGGMTWKADIWSSCEYKKLESKVNTKKKYILGMALLNIQIEKFKKSVSKNICNFFHVKPSCQDRVSFAVFLQGMVAGHDSARMNMGMNKTRMHGNIFSNVFIDRQSGASKGRLQQKNDAETFSGKMV